MKLSEYGRHDGLGLAQLVRRREVSAPELVSLAQSAISQLNPSLNAVVGVYSTPCRAQGAELGPFGGAPFLVKDLGLSIPDTSYESGSRLLSGNRAGALESELLRRFLASGVTILGRTNTPEFGYATTTEPLLHGPTRNPWDLEVSAGGSSGGSAAAVAAGIVPVAHATDAGGSIRIPASMCGVVGLKPSRGRVPLGPAVADPVHGLAVGFVVSRSVRDTAAMLDAVSGPMTGDPFIIPAPRCAFLSCVDRPPRKLRVAFMTGGHRFGHPTHPDCIRAVELVARMCGQFGHEVEPDGPHFNEEAFHRANQIYWTSAITGTIRRASQTSRREPSRATLEATTFETYLRGLSMSATELEEAEGLKNATCRAIGAFFARFDVLVTPAMAVPPWQLGVLRANDASLDADAWYRAVFTRAPFSAPYNMTGQPAMSLPLGTAADNLPVGVQLIGRFADEATLIALAAQLEVAMPWQKRIPPVHVSHLATR